MAMLSINIRNPWKSPTSACFRLQLPVAFLVFCRVLLLAIAGSSSRKDLHAELGSGRCPHPL